MPSHLAGESPLSIVGRRIREAREARGMTLYDLSMATKLLYGGLSRLEDGARTEVVTFSDIVSIAQALHVQIGYLVGEHAFLPPVDKEPTP